MIECTLEVAATRTRQEGGTFYQKDMEEAYIYHYNGFEEKFFDQHGKTFDLQGLDFERIFIYDPPKKSAFQRWNDSRMAKATKEYVLQRKIGWNAAIEAVKTYDKEFGETFINFLESLKEP